jgi:hypothetical protein
LTLLVTRIGADDKDHAAAADDLAMFANSLDAGSDFHDSNTHFLRNASAALNRALTPVRNSRETVSKANLDRDHELFLRLPK